MALSRVVLPRTEEKSGGAGIGSVIGGVLGAIGGTLAGGNTIAGYTAGSAAGGAIGGVAAPGEASKQIQGIQPNEAMQRRVANQEPVIDYHQTTARLADSMKELQSASPELREQYEGPIGKALVMSISKTYRPGQV